MSDDEDNVDARHFRMDKNAESLTISNNQMPCNHVNLVKLQKNQTENTIKLEIIHQHTPSTKCNRVHRKKHHDSQLIGGHCLKNIFKFSFLQQLSVSNSHDFDSVSRYNIIHLIRVNSLFWICLVNATTTLSYAASKMTRIDIIRGQ